MTDRYCSQGTRCKFPEFNPLPFDWKGQLCSGCAEKKRATNARARERKREAASAGEPPKKRGRPAKKAELYETDDEVENPGQRDDSGTYVDTLRQPVASTSAAQFPSSSSACQEQPNTAALTNGLYAYLKSNTQLIAEYRLAPAEEGGALLRFTFVYCNAKGQSFTGLRVQSYISDRQLGKVSAGQLTLFAIPSNSGSSFLHADNSRPSHALAYRLFTPFRFKGYLHRSLKADVSLFLLPSRLS